MVRDGFNRNWLKNIPKVKTIPISMSKGLSINIKRIGMATNIFFVFMILRQRAM